ncbi:hypothetical protein [Stenotrophomonas sp.]|uniref:hypothetical protein n=1 Tax=Stenotrophomonas sp. TaxID=69392 RepID=UPI0028AC0EF3|nr:hypothetical protein [Stenotrophomonas sp.]
MNIDTFGATVRADLDHWGVEFALHRDCEYLGHFSKNMIQVLIDHRGDMPGRAQGYKPLETDARAQRIEDVVTIIWRSNPEMAVVLRAYFCGRGRKKIERWETCNMLLTNMGRPVMNQRAFLEVARRGEDRVRGILEGVSLAA